jgi:hypothetical protein
MASFDCFDWPQLLPELKGEVRRQCDDITSAMLKVTCHEEARAPPKHSYANEPLCILFALAAADGYLNICQWIHAVCLTFEPLTEEERERVTTPGVLFFDDALAHEHFHVAQWAFDTGLPLRPRCPSHLAYSGLLPGLQWVAAHGYDVPEGLMDSLHLPTIRWLVETQHHLHTFRDMWHAICNLPQTEEVLLYFMATGPAFPGIELFDVFYSQARWAIFDFMQTHQPALYARIAEQWSTFRATHQARPDLPWRHYIDIDTGTVCKSDFYDDAE